MATKHHHLPPVAHFAQTTQVEVTQHQLGPRHDFTRRYRVSAVRLLFNSLCCCTRIGARVVQWLGFQTARYSCAHMLPRREACSS